MVNNYIVMDPWLILNSMPIKDIKIETYIPPFDSSKILNPRNFEIFKSEKFRLFH